MPLLKLIRGELITHGIIASSRERNCAISTLQIKKQNVKTIINREQSLPAALLHAAPGEKLGGQTTVGFPRL